MKNFENLLMEISRNKNLAKEFKKLKNTEEFIKFSNKLGVKITEEELNKALIARLPRAKEMSDEELELIAGGRMDFRKVQSLVLAATTFMGVGANVSTSSFAAFSDKKTSSTANLSQKELNKLIEKTAYHNDTSACKKLLSQGVELSEKALDKIYYYAKDEVVNMLIKKYFPINEDQMRSILSRIKLDKETMEHLVEDGLKNGYDIINEHIVNWACREGDPNVAKYLIEKGVKATSYMMDSAAANKSGGLDLVKFLTKKGIKPTSDTLYKACGSFGDINLIKFLVEEQGIKLEDGMLNDAAYSCCNVEVFKYLIKNGLKPTDKTLNNACNSCNTDAIEFFVEQVGIKPTEKALNAVFESMKTRKLKAENKDKNHLINLAKMLIEKGVPITNETLNNACKTNDIGLVKFLFERGASPTNKALENACKSGSLDIVKFLIEKGVSPTSGALDSACEVGNINIVKFLIEKGASPTSGALDNACKANNINIVKFLIEKGASPTSEALDSACEVGNVNIVKFLVEKGVKPTSNSLIKFFGVKVIHPNLEMFQFLIDNGAKPTEEALETACVWGNAKAAKILLDYGIKPTKAIEKYVSNHFNKELIQLLLKHGAKLESNSIIGACSKQDIEILKLLLEKGVKPTEDALYEAARKGNVEIAKLLIENGVEIPEWTMVPACSSGNLDMIKFLMEKGLKINDQAFAQICYKIDDPEIVKSFIDQGAPITDLALRESLDGKHFNVAKLLIENGAKPTSELLEYCCDPLILGRPRDDNAINFLIENGAMPTDDALSDVCGFGVIRLDLVKTFVEHGFKPSEETLKKILGRWSSDDKDDKKIETIEFLIEHGAKITDEVLERACYSKESIDIIKLLMKHGAKATDKALENALKIYRASDDVINFLMENGAKITDETLEEICRNEHFISTDFLDFLIKNGAKPTSKALQGIVAKSKDTEAFMYLVEHGAKITDEIIDSIFKSNILGGGYSKELDLKFIEYLMSKGVNFENNTKALELACRFDGNLELIKFLISHGAKTSFDCILNISYAYEYWLYYMDYFASKKNIIDMLIDNGFDLTSKNEANQNILVYLLNNLECPYARYYKQSKDGFKILLDRNAFSKEDIEEAIKIAKEKGKDEIVEVFSEKLKSMK